MSVALTKVKLQLWMDLLGAFVFAPFRYVFGWFERRRQDMFAQQLALARVQAEAQREMLTSMMGSMEALVKEMGQTSREQTSVLQEWLRGFRSDVAPTATVVTEQDEYESAMRRELATHGFPVDADAESQMRWLASKMDEV